MILSKNYPYGCKCPFCGKESTVYLDLFNLMDYEDGVAVQTAFPTPFYSAEERETIKTGMCQDCQKKIFGE